MSQVEYIEIFLASPSDVQEERKYVYEVIDEINKTNSHEVKLGVKSSQDSYPDYGKDGQKHIVEQLLSEIEKYELLVVIMWNRIGTSTPRTESGTVEEFQNFEEHIERELTRTKIWFYFGKAPAVLDTEEKLEQKRGVVRFKEKIQKKGLYKEYDSPEKFRDEFRVNINQWLKKRQNENIQPNLTSSLHKPVKTQTKQLNNETTDIKNNDIIEGIKNGDWNILKDVLIFKKHSKNDNLNYLLNENNLINEIKQSLMDEFKTDQSIAKYLIELLKDIDKQELVNNYVAGNIINLLSKLGLIKDFSYFDLSRISIWDADLEEAILTGVDFSNSDLKNSSFSEPLGCIHSIAFNADGSYFATGDAHGLIRVYKTESLETRILNNEGKNQIWSVAFGKKTELTQMLAWGAEDGSVKVLNIDKISDDSSSNSSNNVNPSIKIYESNEGRRILAVAFSPNGNLFAIGGDGEKAIKLVEINNNNNQKGVLNATNVSCMTFADDKRIACGNQHGHIRLLHIDTNTTQEPKTGNPVHTGVVRCIAFNEKQKIIASGGEDGTVKMFSFPNLDPLHFDFPKVSEVRTLAFNQDGNILAIGYIDNKNSAEQREQQSEHKIWLWKLQNGKWNDVCELDNSNNNGHEHLIRSIAFCPNPNKPELLISGGDGRKVKLWDINTKKCKHTLSGYANRIWSVAINGDGTTFACSGEDNKIRIWDYDKRTHIPAHILSEHSDWVWSVAFSPKGNILASGSEDNKIFLWRFNGKNWEHTRELIGHNKRVRCVAFSPTKDILASAGNDNKVFIWDLSKQENAQPILNEIPHNDRVLSLAFSPDGKYLASSSRDKTICLIDIEKCNVHNLGNDKDRHTDQVHSIAFSPNSNDLVLVSGGFDQQLKLWQVPSGDCILSWEGDQKILSVAFHPNGKIVASAGANHFITLWDISQKENGKRQALERKRLKGHKRTVESIAFSPDGKRLISCGQDQTVKFWEIYGDINISIHTIELGKPYQGMNIFGIKGLEEHQKAALEELGASRNV